MPRSRSPVRARRESDSHRDRGRDRERGRERDERVKRERSRERSPRDDRGAKRSRRSASRDRRRSRSPRRRDSRRRSRSPRKDAREAKPEPEAGEEGELLTSPANGRSKSRERRRASRSPGRRPRRSEQPELPPPPRAEAASHGAGRPAVKAEESLPPAPAPKKAEPLSLEEYLKKKKAEEEDLAKPKFLSKKQREELALQRRAEEAAAKQQQRAEGGRGGHQPFQAAAERQREERRREEQRRDAADRQRAREDAERSKELELIKKQYLGAEKVKKKARKPSEKFHLNFDWEMHDDTSRDLNPIYNSTHEAALLFGSGKRAGVDLQEQRKQAVEHQRQLLKKMREAQGLEETERDRQRARARLRAAEALGAAEAGPAQEHWSAKSRAGMSERDWRIFREDFNISYKGVQVSGAALPIRNWEEAALPSVLMKAINELGYKAPSPIQMASIPLGLLQRDIIGVAETGSGKTAAFVLPLLCYLMKQPPMTEEVAAEGPYSVIMAPVRELAQQIEEETGKLARHTAYRTVSVVGGQDINEQAFKLRKGCEIVVATPGRLQDCVEQSFAVLNQCNYVVLDEADRMIDMGFEPQVVGVLDAMPSSNLKPEEEDGVLEADRVYRTTIMFSATMPPTVERLARKYMRRPAVINIGSAGKATDNVTQKVYMVKENEKLGLLERELEAVAERRAIVFVNTKRACDTVSRHLEHLEYHCTVLHGGKTQDQREDGLRGFREERFNVLVATDVAGRGIDVPNVALVINYDMPHTIEHYTHRIGRTARAGRKGTAVTLLTSSDTEVYYDLKKLLEQSGAQVPPQLLHHEAAKTKPGSQPQKRDMVQYAKK